MKIVSQPSHTPDQKDVDAICALVSKLEHAQQNELVDEFASLFLPEAVWTTAHGLRLEGAEKIREFTSKVLPGAMAHGTATYTPQRIFFVTPEVAVVNILQQPVTLSGEKLSDVPQGRPTQVLFKTSNGWKIAAAQNTQVVAD